MRVRRCRPSAGTRDAAAGSPLIRVNPRHPQSASIRVGPPEVFSAPPRARREIVRLRDLGLLCLVATLLLFATSALAQARVAGSVRNQDGQPLKGATITGNNPAAAPSTRTATSDAKGRFSFLALGKGEWTFTVDVPGYESSTTKLIVRLLGSNPSLDVVLRAISELPPSGPLANVDVAALHQRLDDAAAHERAGKIDEAIAIYREIATRLPALTMVHLQLGVLHERKQDVAAATAEYQLVLKSEPTNAKARAALERLAPQGKGKEPQQTARVLPQGKRTGLRQATRENKK